MTYVWKARLWLYAVAFDLGWGLGCAINLAWFAAGLSFACAGVCGYFWYGYARRGHNEGPCYDYCTCSACWIGWGRIPFRTRLWWRIQHIWRWFVGREEYL